MNISQLRLFLETLTIKQLKNICVNTRNWGVYHSSTSYTGYSKCRNKHELIELMMKHNLSHDEPHGFYYENEGNQWSYRKIYYNWTYNGETLIMTPICELIFSKYPKNNN